MRGFDQAEFEARTKRAQEPMGAADLSALLLTADTDLHYVTGYLTRF